MAKRKKNQTPRKRNMVVVATDKRKAQARRVCRGKVRL